MTPKPGEALPKVRYRSVHQQRQAFRAFLWPILVMMLSASVCERAAIEPCIHTSIPEKVDIDARYLFYLHGRIIEDEGKQPTHPTFGVYEYEKILQAFADSGFCVISEARSPGTVIEEYAAKLTRQIRTLLERGVSRRHISVVGFSKGAVIALRANTLLGDEQISFVILAGCSQQVADRLNLELTGRVLSVFDASDNVASSCAPVFEKSRRHLVHDELVLSVESRPGLGHGVFYRPQDAWLSPAVRWIRQGDQ
jgi:hypothetical protein